MKKDSLKQIAKKRIDTLFEEAKKVSIKNPSLAKRYITLARKIAMKVNLTLTKDQKRKFCRYCYSYFVPGKNLKVRLKNKKVIYTCLICNKITRFPYIKEKLLSKKIK